MSTRLEEEIGMRDFEDICENVESTVKMLKAPSRTGWWKEKWDIQETEGLSCVITMKQVDGEIRVD